MLYRLALLLGLALACSAGLNAASDQAATLLKTTGKGCVVLPDGAAGEFKAGMTLKPGSRVVTEEAGQAVLMLADGSQVNLGPNTDLTVSELSQDGNKRVTVFELLRGLFKASVQKLTVGSRFEVKTTDAVAAVKGTHFEVEVTDEGTDARVEEGKVWLQDAKSERKEVIEEHKACRAERKGEWRGVRDMTPQERENFGRWVAESLPGGHSGAYLPVDQAKRAAWDKLRPEQRRKVGKDLADSMGAQFWDDVLGLRAEERQERWRDRLRDCDERHLAAEGAKVDFALGKSVIDRQGRRVRFDEYLLRPAADKLQFLNYSRRENRTDTLSSINTYNKALPTNLSDAKGINQRLWVQGFSTPPEFWVKDQALVGGNSLGDSFAMSTSYYDPYFRVLVGFWELPVKDVDIRLGIPDLNAPRVGGIVVEYWTRQYVGGLNPIGGATVMGPSATLTPVAGQLAAVNPFRAVAGTTNNLPSSGFLDGVSSPLIGGTDINNTNLVWSLGAAATLPTTTLLSLDELGAKPGDIAFGFTRTYHTPGALGMTLEFRNYVIDENGQIVNLAGIPPDQLMDEFVKRDLIASLDQIELRSNQFQSSDGINIVSKLLFLHDLTKTQDQL
jgi:hypothetical protein